MFVTLSEAKGPVMKKVCGIRRRPLFMGLILEFSYRLMVMLLASR